MRGKSSRERSMKEERVTFKSGELTLEGMIAYPDAGAGPHRAAVVCHPHPLYGGSMYNNVVDAALEALHARGFATLRFNFRGVGQSEGEFDNGKGEADDAVAAVRFLTDAKGSERRGRGARRVFVRRGDGGAGRGERGGGRGDRGDSAAARDDRSGGARRDRQADRAARRRSGFILSGGPSDGPGRAAGAARAAQDHSLVPIISSAAASTR